MYRLIILISLMSIAISCSDFSKAKAVSVKQLLNKNDKKPSTGKVRLISYLDEIEKSYIKDYQSFLTKKNKCFTEYDCYEYFDICSKLYNFYNNKKLEETISYWLLHIDKNKEKKLFRKLFLWNNLIIRNKICLNKKIKDEEKKLFEIIKQYIIKNNSFNPNNINSLQKKEKNRNKRKEFNRKLREIQSKLKPIFIELVKNRNAIAIEYGYKNYPDLILNTNEISIDWMKNLIEYGEGITRDKFKESLINEIINKNYNESFIYDYHFLEPCQNNSIQQYINSVFKIDQNLMYLSMQEINLQLYNEIERKSTEKSSSKDNKNCEIWKIREDLLFANIEIDIYSFTNGHLQKNMDRIISEKYEKFLYIMNANENIFLLDMNLLSGNLKYCLEILTDLSLYEISKSKNNKNNNIDGFSIFENYIENWNAYLNILSKSKLDITDYFKSKNL